MGTLQNVRPRDFRRFLKALGLSRISTKGGHEKWAKEGMLRPVIFQTHISPIPERIVKDNLRNVGKTREDLEAFIVGKQ